MVSRVLDWGETPCEASGREVRALNTFSDAASCRYSAHATKPFQILNWAVSVVDRRLSASPNPVRAPSASRKNSCRSASRNHSVKS